MSSSFTRYPVTCVSFTGGYSFHEWSPTSTSYCFQVNLLCVNPFLSGGLVCVGWGGDWVSGLLWWSVGKYLWGRKFLLDLHAVDLKLHWAYEFSAGIFRTLCWGGLFAWLLCGPIPGGKGLIVTWRQILNCDMNRESVHIGERWRAYVCMCVSMCARGHACLCACGCSHVLLHACVKNFNCTLTIACTCA